MSPARVPETDAGREIFDERSAPLVKHKDIISQMTLSIDFC